MSKQKQTSTLSVCDKIKLSDINHLQPFCTLIIVDSKTLGIVAVSENIHESLSVDPQSTLKKPLHNYLDTETIEFLKDIIDSNNPYINVRHTTFYSSQFTRHKVSITAHQNTNYLFLEIEHDQNFGSSSYLANSQAIFSSFNHCQSKDTLFNNFLGTASKIVQADSIMIYQYLEDYNGKVVAQKKKTFMPNYIDHYFPATDTPLSVRNAFLKRYLRYIPDVNAKSVTLISQGRHKKFDLTRVINRGVATHHRDFLNNMKIGGAISLSIVIENKLWGLVTIHFKKPSTTHIHSKNFLVLLTNLLASRIYQLELQELSTRRHQALEVINTLSKDIETKVSDFELIDQYINVLKQVVICHGHVTSYDGKLHGSTSLLSNVSADRLYKHALKISRLNATGIDHLTLSKLLTKKEYDKIRSALVIVISYELDIYVILFRFGVKIAKKWAGDPFKNTSTKTPSPRLSFKTWIERSEKNPPRWEDVELTAISQIQREIIDSLLKRQLTVKAFRDQLTKTYNRHYLSDSYQKETSLAKRYNQSVVLAIIDLDFFKQVNDTYGHDAGDKVLKQVSKLMLRFFRLEDTVCRFGGEEFIILSRSDKLNNVNKRFLLLKDKIFNNPFKIKSNLAVNVSVSIGLISFSPSSKKSLECILPIADKLLYKAKKQGRNQIVYKHIS